MSVADDLAAEVRAQCLAAEHFKNLWMQTNEELEHVKQQNALLRQKLPKHELEFAYSCRGLVMSHIDRMNDVCEQDTAQGIINSMTSKFRPIFDLYLSQKFPNQDATQKEIK
jgi:hypothetical protein